MLFTQYSLYMLLLSEMEQTEKVQTRRSEKEAHTSTLICKPQIVVCRQKEEAANFPPDNCGVYARL